MGRRYCVAVFAVALAGCDAGSISADADEATAEDASGSNSGGETETGETETGGEPNPACIAAPPAGSWLMTPHESLFTSGVPLDCVVDSVDPSGEAGRSR